MCSGKAETPGDGRGLVEAYAIFGPPSTALLFRPLGNAAKQAFWKKGAWLCTMHGSLKGTRPGDCVTSAEMLRSRRI